MDELDDRGEQRVLLAADSRARVAASRTQHRPQALAAAADDVLGDLVDQHDVGGQARADQRVDGAMSGSGQRLHVGKIHDGDGRDDAERSTCQLV